MCALTFWSSVGYWSGSIRSSSSSWRRLRYSAASCRTASVPVEELGEGLGHGEAGQHLGRVVRRRLLALAASEPEDEGPLLMPDRAPLPGQLILDSDEVVGVDMARAGHGDNPRTLGRVAVLGHLEEILPGEEAGEGHEALVYGAELVDAELDVGDEASITPLRLLAQQEVSEHPLERDVAESDLVDERGGLGKEEVCPHGIEDEPFDFCGFVRSRLPGIPVAGVHKSEELLE